jgi:tRNA (guanine37-N1)-methyltransferase
MLDLKSVYFSVRSGNERKRIADLVQPGEKILVMFSGVAPFPLMIEKYSKASSITGIEINKRAHDYGLINVRLNKAQNISLLHGDARQVVGSPHARFDRIVMPLPAHAELFLRQTIQALAPSGALHYYDFKAKASFQESIEVITAEAAELGRSVRCSEVVVCGHTSPNSYRICVDAIID